MEKKKTKKKRREKGKKKKKGGKEVESREKNGGIRERKILKEILVRGQFWETIPTLEAISV